MSLRLNIMDRTLYADFRLIARVKCLEIETASSPTQTGYRGTRLLRKLKDGHRLIHLGLQFDGLNRLSREAQVKADYAHYKMQHILGIFHMHHT